MCPYLKCCKDYTVAALFTLLYRMWIMWFFLFTSFFVVLAFFPKLSTLLPIKIGKLCWYPRGKICKTILVLFCHSRSKNFKFNLCYNTVVLYLFSKFCYLLISSENFQVKYSYEKEGKVLFSKRKRKLNIYLLWLLQ